MKTYLYSIYCTTILLAACNLPNSTIKQSYTDDWQSIQGKTLGTTYSVKFNGANIKADAIVDSILNVLNMQLSTYIDTSTINRFNKSISTFKFDTIEQNHFWNNYQLAKNCFEASEGYFDPTVMPIVKYYGFSYNDAPETIDSTEVKRLMQFIGFDKLELVNKVEDITIRKEQPETQLDFSAVAKGYAVDIIADFLEGEGVSDYFVEIGGELRCRGKNMQGIPWRIGIEDPQQIISTNRSLKSILSINNQSVATSGNYRNFRKIDGKKWVHTINPKTGFPYNNRLLSATVVASSCAMADALATACMAQEMETARQMIEQLELKGLFMYLNENHELKYWISPSLKEQMVLAPE